MTRFITGRLDRQPNASYRSVAVARSPWSLGFAKKFTIFQASCTALLICSAAGAARPAMACTFFVKTQGGVTLAGNSEDYYEADTCAVIIPPSEGKYGRIYFTGKNANLLLPDTIESRGWTHIAIRQDVSAFRLSIFRNGREILSTMLHSTPMENDSPLHLGGSRIARRSGFHGALDDLVIYRRALSNEEITALAAE